MGLFDNNGGFFGYEPTDADRQQALYQGLLGLGAQLTASGAPTLTPGGNSHHMANAGNAFNQGMTGYLNHQKMGHQQKQQSQMQNIMAGLEMKKHQAAMAQQNARQEAMASMSPEEQRNATLGGDHYWKARFAQPKQQPTFETVQDPFGRGGVGQKDSITGKIVNYQGPPDPPEQPGGHFAGNGMAAQTYNTLMLIRPKIENGTATPVEQQAYGLAYQHVSRPQRYTTPDGRMYEQPGMDLAGFPVVGDQQISTPPGQVPAVQSELNQNSSDAPVNDMAITLPTMARQIGNPKISDTQRISAGFAERMEKANEILMSPEFDVEAQGSGMWATVEGSEVFPNVLKSEDRQLFEQAKRSFVNAVLRKESGAVISDQEFDNAERQYFPVPGDSKKVIEQKRQERLLAIQSMKASAGPAVFDNNNKAQIQNNNGADLPPGFELVED